jgi:hypothetical protein
LDRFAETVRIVLTTLSSADPSGANLPGYKRLRLARSTYLAHIVQRPFDRPPGNV